MVTDEQISTKVLNAVRGMFSTVPGTGHSGVAKRRTMYAPISPVKNMTSEQRKIHIPNLSWRMPVVVYSSSRCTGPCPATWPGPEPAEAVSAAACCIRLPLFSIGSRFPSYQGRGRKCSAIPTETRIAPRIRVEAKMIPSVLRSKRRCMK